MEEELACVSEGQELLEEGVDGNMIESVREIDVKKAPLGTEFLTFATVDILKVGHEI